MGFDPSVGRETDQTGRKKCGSQSDEEPEMWMGYHGTAGGDGPWLAAILPSRASKGGLLVDSPGEECPQLFTFIDHDCEDGAQLNGDLCIGGHITCKAQGMAGQDEMACRRNR